MNYYITSNDYLMHHGVKGMKWGVRKERDRLPSSERKKLKIEYKTAKRNLSETQNRQYRSYVNAVKDSSRKVHEATKSERQKYKSGEITKAEYKARKSNYQRQKRDFDRQQEYKMAVAQYHVERIKSENRLKYVGIIKGTNSKAWKRGVERYKKGKEYWGNYTIQERSDGTYRVTRTDYYYY